MDNLCLVDFLWAMSVCLCVCHCENMQYSNAHEPCSNKSAIGSVWQRLQGPADMDWSYNGPCFRWRKTSAALIFTNLQGSGDYSCTRRNTIQVTQTVKNFSFSMPLPHTHWLLYSALSRSLDSTVLLHEWWAVFTCLFNVCTQKTAFVILSVCCR